MVTRFGLRCPLTLCCNRRSLLLLGPLKNSHNATSATETVATRAAASTTRRNSTASANDNNENDFARAFGHVQMSAALRIKAEEFSAQAQRRAEARRQETGNDGGNDED